MKDFRVIVTDNKKDFEQNIEKNLNEGYKMINSNITINNPEPLGLNIIKNAINQETQIYFYAYMEKKTEE